MRLMADEARSDDRCEIRKPLMFCEIKIKIFECFTLNPKKKKKYQGWIKNKENGKECSGGIFA